MTKYKVTEAEERLAEIIWNNEPIKSSELVLLSTKAFDWKKSTTYTMLKRLEDKKIFKNKQGTVVSLIRKDDFYAEQSKLFVDENFGGSLPKFIAAFSKRSKLSDREIEALENLINSHKED